MTMLAVTVIHASARMACHPTYRESSGPTPPKKSAGDIHPPTRAKARISRRRAAEDPGKPQAHNSPCPLQGELPPVSLSLSTTAPCQPRQGMIGPGTRSTLEDGAGHFIIIPSTRPPSWHTNCPAAHRGIRRRMGPSLPPRTWARDSPPNPRPSDAFLPSTKHAPGTSPGP